MTNDDLEKFIEIWSSSCEVFGPRPTDGAVAIVFKVLEPFGLADIERAMGLHLGQSKFSPKPADIIELINQANPDGHLGADEAWAIAIQTFDENATVITTREISYACPTACQIYNDGDHVGARMAFRQAYEPLIKAAREKGEPAQWFPTLGHDVGQRKSAILGGIQQGLLPTKYVAGILEQLSESEIDQVKQLALERSQPTQLLESDK